MKNGFSLLELILVLGVGTTLAFLKFQDMLHDQEEVKASAAGQQIKQLGEAVNGYINIRYDKLSTLSNSTGTGTDPGPRTCTTSNSVCSISYQTLINEGLLPSTYVARNSFGSDYSIQLKRSGTSPNYVIDGVVLTNAAWVEGGRVRYDLLGKAMQSAGIDSATTKTTSQMNGFGGTWTLQQSDFSAINKQGLLGFRVGYNASLYSAYLRRDGTLPMTGNLDMGANDISNAKNVTASGTGTFGGEGYFGSNVNSGGNITAAGQVIAHNGYGDVITFGGDANNNDYEISLGSPKQLTIYSPSAANYTTVLQVNRNTKIDQRLSTNGLDPNEMPPGFSAGGVRTVDVVATGSFYSILAGTTISEGKYGFYARQDGNVKASGNMTVDGRIKTGEYLEIGSVVTAGSSCSPAGLLGRDSTGQVLSCKGGIWSPEMPVCIPQPWPSATIPAGWLECNGQAFNKSQYPLLAKAYPSGVLPDLRGQFIRGLDNGRGKDSGRTLLSEQRASVVTGTDDNWASSDVGALHGPSSAYSRDTINVYDYTTGSNGQDPKYYLGFGGSTTGPSLGSSESGNGNIPLVNNGSNGFYGGARPTNTAFMYIVRAL